MFYKIGYFRQTPFRELYAFVFKNHIQIVRLYHQPARFQFNFFSGVEYQDNIFIFDHIKNEQGRILIVKIDFLFIIPGGLAKIVTLLVFADACMKVVDYFFVLKFSILIMPATVCIKPEYGVVLRDDYFFELFGHIIV